MHNGVHPGLAKVQTRPTSPQFEKFPHPDLTQVEVNAPPQNLHLRRDSGQMSVAQHGNISSMLPVRTMPNKQKSTGSLINSNLAGMNGGNGNLGHHRGDFTYPDDMDSIEICLPMAATSYFDNGGNSELLLMTGHSDDVSDPESFAERHRRSYGQQVKWSRRNIAATMERFEPTQTARCSSSSTSSLEYGFSASVVTSGIPSSNSSQVSSGTQLLPSCNETMGSWAPHNHVYSYAYYEPGAAKCHTNVPQKEISAFHLAAVSQPTQTSMGSLKNGPRNSIRSILARSLRSKSNSGQSPSSSPSVEDRHTYTTRYGTTENLYEEVNEQKIRKVLSDNRIAISAPTNVKEELRRVQHNHFRVLDELNLSLEALIMPPSPLDSSPKELDDNDDIIGATAAGGIVPTASSPTVHAAAPAQKPRRYGLLGGNSSSLPAAPQPVTFSQANLDNLSSSHNLMELKEQSHNSCSNVEFDEGDLDSGFSGSGSSSGASYNDSIRCYKTGGGGGELQGQVPINTSNNCRSPTTSGTSTSKSSMASQDDHGISLDLSGCGIDAPMMGAGGTQLSPFDFVRRCSSSRNSSLRAESVTGTKPKRSFWTINP